jgi:hypothetical protein
MKPSHGILYIATGEKYILAAIRSAESAAKYCPKLSTHLYADWQNYDFHFDRLPYPFSSVGRIENPHRRSKVDFLARSPYDYTLYLDSDTSVNMDIQEMFGLLDRFDIALNHEFRRNNINHTKVWRIELPNAYPQFNGGVLLYRKNPAVLRFLDAWSSSFKIAGFPQDQVTLRELLWLSDLRIATLPPEYNVRYLKYHFLWSRSEARTKIFHLQFYHDGPFWFLKNWAKLIGRPILLWFGIKPAQLKKFFGRK